MSRDATIEFDFADGRYKFRLGIGELEELDEKTDRGPYELLRMIDDHTWRTSHVREVIRIGIIGGGLEPVKATKLLKRYLDDRPLIEWLPYARLILFACLAGPRDGEAPGKAKRRKARQGQSDQEESSLSPPSTDKQQQ